MLVLCANPSCGTKFPRPDTDAGRVVMCPQCGKSTAARAAGAAKPELGQLGDFKLIRPVAKGGMGEIYEATQLRLGRSVALKVLNRNLATDEQFIQRFEREAKAAAALNHPNIVHVYDFAQEDGQAYLVMEYIEGQDLSKIVSQTGKMPIKDALKIVADVASALQEAHAKGIIHRDIKPASILLTTKGVVKVSDLGLARHLDDDSDLTATGAGIGTPHFMSPEQARDAHHVDHRADIYSLGITLLYLLTGKRPYEGKSSYSIVLAHSTEPLPSGLELGTELPEPVEALLHKMSAKDPGDRYADYPTLLADIKRVLRGEMPEGKLGQDNSTVPFVMPKKMPSSPANPPKPLDITASVPTVSAPTQTQTGESRFLQIAMAVGILCTAIVSLVALMHSLKDKAPQTVAEASDKAEDNGGADGKNNDLRPEDFRALEEMMSQPRGGAGMRGNSMERPDPLTPLPPELDHLKDAPVAEMLAEADAYALAMPTDYRGIIDRYDQVLRKADDPELKRDATAKWGDWQRRQFEAVKIEYATFSAKVKQTITEKGHRIGMQMWKDFPDSLRGAQSDTYVKENIMRDFPPPAVGEQGLRNAPPRLRNGLPPRQQ